MLFAKAMRKPLGLAVGLVALVVFFYNPAISASQSASFEEVTRSLKKVKRFFSRNKIGDSPDFALVKDGYAGPDKYLIVIFGYADDRSVCEGLIKPADDNPYSSMFQGGYSCEQLTDEFTEQFEVSKSMKEIARSLKKVKRFFSRNKIGDSPDFALVKDGYAGPEYLMVIFGYADDRSVCEELIKPVNDDPSLSVFQGVYSCEQLNR